MRGVSKVVLAAVIIIVIVVVAAAALLYKPAPPTPPAKKVKVAVLFDVGGRGDLSFNDMAWMGAERASKELGVTVEYMTPKSLADMIPLLESLSKTKEYDIIVLVGFLWTDPLNKTADKFPDQKFALIDATTGVTRKNEVDLLFKEQECAALVGVLASDMSYNLNKEIGLSKAKIGAVAGMDIPPLWKFHIGYLFGAKYYELKTGTPVEFSWIYTGTFTDTAKGYETANSLLREGVNVLYGLAGLTHVGMFNAVKEWNEKGYGKAFALGQDASQEWYAPQYMPLSGAKRVDNAVYTAIEMVVKGAWKSGIYPMGLAEGGVGIWDLDGVKWFAEQAASAGKLTMTPDQVVSIVKGLREKYISKNAQDLAADLEKRIKNGEIVFKTPTTHEEYERIIGELLKGNLNAALAKGTVG